MHRGRAIWVALRSVAWAGAVGLVACVGGGGNSTQDAGGTGGTGACVSCGPNCFDCGGGCQCSTPDASVAPHEWKSPFPNTGLDGTWRSNTTTFCPRASNLEVLDLWSDPRGVYALIAGQGALDTGSSVDARPSGGGSSGGADPIAGSSGGSAGAGGVSGAAGVGGFGGTGSIGGNCGSGACVGEAVYFNDGVDGWRLLHDRQELAEFSGRRLSGVPLGPVVLHGTPQRFQGGESCALGRVDDGNWVCDRFGGNVRAFFAVSPTLAYAALDREILVFDGSEWSAPGITAPAPVAALWSDGTTLVVIDDRGQIAQFRDDIWTLPLGTVHAQSVWGSAADDLWFIDGDLSGFSNARNLVHFDGVTSQVAATIPIETCGDFDFTLRLWGAGGSIYVHGDRSLYRWNGTELVELSNWICAFEQSARITRVWGNGDNEVFVGLLDYLRPESNSCGAAVVMYFDGALFHEI